MGVAIVEYYTYEDYKNWEGDWELIGGVAYAMAPAPLITHQFIANMISFELNKNLECEECKVLSEVDYKVNEYTVLRPDVVLSCNDDEERYLTKAPKIVFEVISPSTARRDEEVKFKIYEEEGVKFYGIVYPNDLRVKLYKNIDGKFKKIGDFSKESFDFGICGVKVDFENVFRRLRKNKC